MLRVLAVAGRSESAGTLWNVMDRAVGGPEASAPAGTARARPPPAGGALLPSRSRACLQCDGVRVLELVLLWTVLVWELQQAWQVGGCLPSGKSMQAIHDCVCRTERD